MKKLFALFTVIVLCFAMTSVHGSEPLNQGYATPTDIYMPATPTDMYSYATPTDMYSDSIAYVTSYIQPDTYDEPIIGKDSLDEQVANYTPEGAVREYQQLPVANSKNKKTYTIQMLDSDMTPITDMVFIGAIDDDGITIWLDEFCMYVAIAPVK